MFPLHYFYNFNGKYCLCTNPGAYNNISQLQEFLNTAFMGLDDSTRVTKLASCKLAKTPGIGLEFVPYVKNTSGWTSDQIIEALPVLDNSSARVSVNEINFTDSRFNFIGYHGKYVAQIVAFDATTYEHKDFAEVEICVKNMDGVGSAKLIIKVTPLDMYETVDFTAYTWHLDMPSRMGETLNVTPFAS